MNLRVVSDIHTEFHGDGGQGWLLDQDHTGVDVLVVAGDLAGFDHLPHVLRGLCLLYPHVVYVNGNHELYRASFDKVKVLRAGLMGTLPNLHWLYNSEALIDGQRFLGTTMWFRDDPLNVLYRDQLSDYRTIKGGFAKQVIAENRYAVEYLRANIRQGDIVVTHHLPSEHSVDERYISSDLNRFYVCHMDATIAAQKPALWCHGHSHASCDYRIGETRVVSNPLGYVGYALNPNFNEAHIVTV